MTGQDTGALARLDTTDVLAAVRNLETQYPRAVLDELDVLDLDKIARALQLARHRLNVYTDNVAARLERRKELHQ